MESTDDGDDNVPESDKLQKRKIGKRFTMKKGLLGVFGGMVLLTHVATFYVANHIEPVAPPNYVWSVSRGAVRYDPKDPEPYDEVILRPISRAIGHTTFRGCEAELRRLNPSARLVSIDLLGTNIERSMIYRITYRVATYQHENWIVPCTVRVGGVASIHF